MINQFNFTELMCEADGIADLNTRELLLWKTLASYEQTVLYADDFPMQVKSAIYYLQKERELPASLLAPDDEKESTVRNLKFSTCLILELLTLLGKGRGVNDLTSMSKLVSLVTGFSYHSILNNAQQGIYLTERQHGAAIQEVNGVLMRLGVPVRVEVGVRY